MTRHIDENSAPFSLQQSLLQELEWKPTKKVKDDGTSYYFFFIFFVRLRPLHQFCWGSRKQEGGRLYCPTAQIRTHMRRERFNLPPLKPHAYSCWKKNCMSFEGRKKKNYFGLRLGKIRKGVGGSRRHIDYQ